MSMTHDQVESCSQDELGAQDSYNQGLNVLKSYPKMHPHIINVLLNCSEAAQNEFIEQLLDYLENMGDSNAENSDNT